MDRKVEWGEGVFVFLDELLEGDLHGKRVLSLGKYPVRRETDEE